MGGHAVDLRQGSIWGIPVKLHWSWSIIFLLLTGSLSLGYYAEALPRLPHPVYWLLGTITSLLFFIAVLAHEYGHAVLALHYGIPVENITLLVFGGVANLAHEPRTAREELHIALAGPIVSLGCALLAWLFWTMVSPLPLFAYPAAWLARINLALVIFNMIPGFPLDGGRVFRAAAWRLTGNYTRATRITQYFSTIIAFGLIGYGVFSMVQSNYANGIWLICIGWFLVHAAAASAQQSLLQRSLGNEQVVSLMSRDFKEVSVKTSVAQLIDGIVSGNSPSVIFVEDQGQLRGIISLHDIASLPRASWDTVKVEQVMSPIRVQDQVNPEASLLSAMMAMDRNQMALLPVVIGGLPAGLISREQVLRYMHLHKDVNK